MAIVQCCTMHHRDERKSGRNTSTRDVDVCVNRIECLVKSRMREGQRVSIEQHIREPIITSCQCPLSSETC